MPTSREMKMANNILEFLIDPTVFPVRQRLYFRPEEKLQNEFYEGAKADSFKAYGTEQHNSDFYPIRNRQQSQREATVMDRKTMIASLDVLSQNFEENDPIAMDLRTMAFAVSKMADDEFNGRVAAKTFPCPTCGTKVLEQTSYCVKCKKKVKPGAAKKAGDETCEKCGKNPCACQKEEACDKEAYALSTWNKSAADAVRKALVEDVFAGDDDAPAAEPEKEPKPAEEPKKKEEAPAAAPAAPVKKEEMVEAKKEEVPAAPAKKEEAPAAAPAATPAAPAAEPVQAKIVNTDILVAQKLGDIEIQPGILTAEDVGPLTSEEKARLDSVLAFSDFDDLDEQSKQKLSSLLHKQ